MVMQKVEILINHTPSQIAHDVVPILDRGWTVKYNKISNNVTIVVLEKYDEHNTVDTDTTVNISPEVRQKIIDYIGTVWRSQGGTE
jgi:hypothetical protein